jgi:mono/diheme cytochrome c family protein
MKISCVAALLIALPLASAAAEPAKPVDVSKLPLPVPRKVDFTQEVYPLLKESCFSCHGAQKQKGKYRCDTKEGAFKDTEHGPTIVPGSSEQSALIHMVCGLIDEMLMPPPSDKPGQSEKLTNEQVGILRAWIDQGAVWPDGPIAEVVKTVTFAVDIQPMFATACASCHTGGEAKGGFDAGSLASVLKGGQTYGKAVLPGDLKKSPLVTIVAGLDEDLPLPEKHKLPPKQLELVKKWVEQGAK